jgi:hypothetical protein
LVLATLGAPPAPVTQAAGSWETAGAAEATVIFPGDDDDDED